MANTKLFAELIQQRMLQNLSRTSEREIKTIFLITLECNMIDTAKMCLDILKTPNYGKHHAFDDNNGPDDIQPLLYAATQGKLRMVKFLVENGADIEYLSIYGSTAIMFAFQNGHTDVVIYLLDKGAKITTDKKTTAGFYVCVYRNEYTKMLERSNELYNKLQTEYNALKEKMKNLDTWKTDIASALEYNAAKAHPTATPVVHTTTTAIAPTITPPPQSIIPESQKELGKN